MGLVQTALCYRCSLCGSRFFLPEEADGCCKRAKAQILCARLRNEYAGDSLEHYCNVIKASVLGRKRMVD